MRKWMMILLAVAAVSGLWAASDGTRIDLSGMWRFQLDPMGFGQTPGSELYLDRLAETIMLPGSTDQGGKGIKNNARYVDRLSRKFEYMGMAWYQREFTIPKEWAGKVVRLRLERCHWETTVYVDGNCVGSDERLSTPNVFDLTRVATPGVHTLTLCVDNRLKYPMDQWTHGTTEYTQTNWNGVVGEMVLEAKEPCHLRRVDIYHPSFILMCNGNENEGNFDVLEDLVRKGRAYDDRHLYSASTARTHTPSDQYYVSHVTSKGGITVYEGVPRTNWDKNAESDIDVPVIAHETGQRCMYPDFAEMSKYTGVLEARNFEVFRERLARNGMLAQADDFFRATGAHTVLQYKEVNESLLRSSRSGGFQLLGLADFPGQGSAFVGILDAFWEDKGLVSPEKFRESCAPVVLLARLPKRTFLPEETLDVEFDLYHFGPEALKGKAVQWTLADEAGHVVGKGALKQKTVQPSTVDSLGRASCPLAAVTKACKLTLTARLGDVRNEWDIWVYPAPADTPADFVYATAWDESAKAALEAGRSVLLVPEKPQGRKTHFASHFWNPIMFDWDPMIVGTLIDAAHPAFADFPTASYADWQWWDVLNHATAMELNGLRNLTPVIQSIDTYEHNRKLGIAFEANVGKGRLFVLQVNDLQKTENLPAMRQLLYSVKRYVASDRFSPSATLQPYELDALFAPARRQENTDASGAAVMQLLNR